MSVVPTAGLPLPCGRPLDQRNRSPWPCRRKMSSRCMSTMTAGGAGSSPRWNWSAPVTRIVPKAGKPSSSSAPPIFNNRPRSSSSPTASMRVVGQLPETLAQLGADSVRETVGTLENLM